MIQDLVKRYIPERIRETASLRAFGLAKIPLLGFCTPKVVELDGDHCVVAIGLNRRTRNHLGSMYFGALAVGADCAGGLIAYRQIQLSKKKISLVFKDFQAEFLKRPEGEVHFICDQGTEIRDLVERADRSGERENLVVKIRAVVPAIDPHDPVALFRLTLSLKRRN